MGADGVPDNVKLTRTYSPNLIWLAQIKEPWLLTFTRFPFGEYYKIFGVVQLINKWGLPIWHMIKLALSFYYCHVDDK